MKKHTNQYSIDDIVLFRNSNNQLTIGKITYQTSNHTYLLQEQHRIIKIPTASIVNTSPIFNPIYTTQASNHLKLIKKIHQKFTAQNIPYVFIKSLPTYQYLYNTFPKRLMADIDILISPSHKSQALTILQTLNYYPSPHTPPHTSQYHCFNSSEAFPYTIDLHLQPAISFTQFPLLSKLISNQNLTRYFLTHTKLISLPNDIRVPILQPKAMLILLSLHFFHHHFQGYHRLKLLADLSKDTNLDWNRFLKDVKHLQLDNIVYFSLLITNHLYPNRYINQYLPHFNVNQTTLIISKLFTRLPTTFFLSRYDNNNPLKKLLLSIIVSPYPLTQQLKLIFNYNNLKHITQTLNYKHKSHSNFPIIKFLW